MGYILMGYIFFRVRLSPLTLILYVIEVSDPL